MSNLKIVKIELTAFEIELNDIQENKSGIGIVYTPGITEKHVR